MQTDQHMTSWSPGRGTPLAALSRADHASCHFMSCHLVARTCHDDKLGAVRAEGLPAARLLHVEFQVSEPHQDGGICRMGIHLVQVQYVCQWMCQISPAADSHLSEEALG